jgi:hypothetical protein
MAVYKELADDLAVAGIHCHFQSPGQLVVSGQVGPTWPDRGNNFWVTNVDGQWYLFTWVPIGYRVPESHNFVELCRKCMEVGHEAMHQVPPEIVDEFGLIELSEEDAENVMGRMDLDE